MVLGDLDSYMQKNETWSPAYTIYQNKLKVDKRLKYKSWHHKSLREEHRQEYFRYSMQQYFHQYVTWSKDINKRRNKEDYFKLESLCLAKEYISKIKRKVTIWKNSLLVMRWTRVWSPKYIKISHDSTLGRQTIQLKIGKVPVQTLLQGGHTEGPETYERMLCITSHQRASN